MKVFVLAAVVLLVCFLTVAASPKSFTGQKNRPGRIIKSSTASEISLKELAEEISDAQIVVLGEEHYSLPIQAAQARVIRTLVKKAKAKGSFTTAWEFLNSSEQKYTDEVFKQLKSGEIDAYEFLEEIFGNNLALSYAPVIEATGDLEGKLIGVNISRTQKRPVAQNGIGAADPKIVPPGYRSGSKRYFERFKEAAKHHASTDNQIKNMFDAQCLTDDVMALNLLNDKAKLKFLVVGSFHSDYSDGVVDRIRTRSSGSKTITIRFMDVSEYYESEIPDLIHSLQYGRIADYVYFVGSFKKD